MSPNINREAFRTLGEFLLKRPKTGRRFHMSYWSEALNGRRHLRPCDVPNECGTVACAAGHGPLAGLAPLPQDTTWQDYICRVFFDHYVDGATYNWAFSYVWSDYDNSRVSAAHRCLYVAEHSRPPVDFGGFNYEDFKGFRT